MKKEPQMSKISEPIYVFVLAVLKTTVLGGLFCNMESLLCYTSFSLYIIIDSARFKWNKAWSGPQGKKDGYVPILPNDSALYNYCVAFKRKKNVYSLEVN